MIGKIRPIDRLFVLGVALLGAILLMIGVLFRQQLSITSSPMVAYIGNPLDSPEVWLISANGGQAFQLTSTGGEIYDFSVSPDGKRIAYSAHNDTGGMDIYLIDREGNEMERLVDCGEYNCSQMAWSPDSKQIAYSQYGPVLEDNPVVKVISVKPGFPVSDLLTGNIEGAYPSFSPDGRYFASYSFSEGGHSVIDLEMNDRAIVPSNNPDRVSWSQDPAAMFYTSFANNGLLPQSVLMQYDLEMGQSQPILGDQLTGFDVSRVDWSPDGVWAAIGLKAPDDQSGRQIYLTRKDGQDFRAITADAGASHAAYSWSPQGHQLIFQRYTPGSSNSQPEVMLWRGNTDSLDILVQDAALPAWVP